jgi:hypothetical protein
MPDENKRPLQIAEQARNWFNFSLASFLTFCGFVYATAIKDIDSQNTGNRKGIKTLAVISLSALVTAAISGYKSFSLYKRKEKTESEVEKRERCTETIAIVKEVLAQEANTLSPIDNNWQKKQDTEKEILAANKNTTLTK